jgi:phosphonate transport system substrate-binding protein
MPHTYLRPASSRVVLRDLLAYTWTLCLAVLVSLVPQVTRAESLTIGSIGLEPAAEIKNFLPLARYLAQQLAPEGIAHGGVVVADSVRQMAVLLQDGKVDLYLDSPFPTLAVSRLSGSRLLLRRWKEGIDEYHSVIFARQDSGIHRLEDLQGQLIAFEKPFSTSGYFLPKLALLQAGLHVVPKREEDPVRPDEVGYVFSRHDENTMVWVLRGKVLAGAIDSHRLPIAARGSLDRVQVIYRTFAVPRHIVSYRADLPSPLLARIREILLQMDQVEEGKNVLHAFERTTRFDEIPEHTMTTLSNTLTLIEAEFGLP